jgi:MFS family permease
VTSLVLRAAIPAATREASAPRLFNRNFRLLWQAQLVSQFGNQAFAIALTFWTAETTHSATLTGLMLMAGVLPVVVLGPLTGTFVDRQRSTLRIIVACDLASGALVGLLALGFVSGAGAWRPAMLFAAALLVGVCNAFFDPAVNAFAPDLVPRDQLEAANALRQSSRQVAMLSAQGLAGILYALVGPAMLFVIDALSFLFAGATEMLIAPPSKSALRSEDCGVRSANDADGTPRTARRFLGDAADGFRYMRAQPGMIAFLIVASTFNALLMPIAVLLPVFATVWLHAGVRWYGLLLAAISAGGIAGCALLMTRRATLTGPSRRALLLVSFAALALSLVALGQVRSPWLALAIAGVTGMLAGTINVLVLSIIQRRTSGEFRGRVIGLHSTMTRALVPIGMVGGGAAADLAGRNVPLVYGLCGALALASVGLLVASRSTRAFLASA